MTGTIKAMPIKDGKPRDFTFVNGEDGKTYFLHISEFKSPWQLMVKNLPANVTFTPTEGKKGNKAMSCDLVPNS